jgi:hypothetical protein
MMLLSLLLTAAPVLEPDPGALPRIQPREVSAADDSALWAVDDDPATAWKAPLEKASLGWSAGAHDESTSMSVFIRAGCQDSLGSFAAWGRPHHIVFSPRRTRPARRLMAPYPLILELADEKAPEHVAELQDVAGWQRVDVPLTPALRNGFVLNVKDTFPGKQHSEVCLSDLRVYLDGKDKVDASEEQLAFDGIKRSIAERLTRPKAAPRRLPAKFSSTDIDVGAPPRPPKGELALQSPDALPTFVKRARATAAELRAAWKVPVSQLEANGWKRASLRSVLDDDASPEAALAGAESVCLMGDGLLAADDFSLVAASSPLTGLKAIAKKVEKLAEKPLECRAVCLPSYAATSTQASLARSDCQRVCDFGKYAGPEMRADLGGSGIFVKGGLDSPREVLLVASREGGEREIMRRSQRELLVYDNGRVAAVASITFDAQYVETQLLSWADDRSSVRSVVRMSLEGSRVESATQVVALQEHAAGEAPGEVLAFDVQR